MNLRAPLALASALLGAGALAQYAPPPLPARGPAPLLFVRLGGLPGMRVTLFQGRAAPRSFNLPVVVGLRPGYLYRLELSGIPGQTVHLYPTLEVQSSLTLPPRLNAASFPAPVNFTELDLTSALAGNLITKMIYLEHPDRAEPRATEPGELLETPYPANRDLQAAARQRGRPMLVLRLGDGVPGPEEMARGSVPGTILHPGERSIARPPCPPLLPPPVWAEEECLHDGGDRGERAGLDAAGQLYGVEPEDTVAEFTDSHGRRGVTCSNRVCLCVPRFAALRTELVLGRAEAVQGAEGRQAFQGQQLLARRQPTEQASQAARLEAARGRERPGVNVAVKGPGAIVHFTALQAHHLVLGLAELIGTTEMRRLTQIERAVLKRQLELARELSITSRVRGTEQVVTTAVVARVEQGAEVLHGAVEVFDLTVCCDGPPALPDKPLKLIKVADAQSARVGDVITFTLRYSNHGGRPITDVAVTDSLSGRLEYVPDSAESDRPAVFTTQENEAGSLVLRWEITGTVRPGESGRVRFKARVR
jgi:uncharacterized repeat protein (TIGR01451 family)